MAQRADTEHLALHTVSHNSSEQGFIGARRAEMGEI